MDQGVVIENSSENIEVSADMTGGVSIEDAEQGYRSASLHHTVILPR